MPIYEYRCNSCGHGLERLQRMSDAPLTDCPQCSEAELRRLISPAGFRLKGSGWYETDFKKGSKRNITDRPSSDDGKAASKEDPAKPAESKSDDGGKKESKSADTGGKSKGEATAA